MWRVKLYRLACQSKELLHWVSLHHVIVVNLVFKWEPAIRIGACVLWRFPTSFDQVRIKCQFRPSFGCLERFRNSLFFFFVLTSWWVLWDIKRQFALPDLHILLNLLDLLLLVDQLLLYLLLNLLKNVLVRISAHFRRLSFKWDLNLSWLLLLFFSLTVFIA